MVTEFMKQPVYLQSFTLMIFLVCWYGTPELSGGIRLIRGMRSIVYMLQTIHYLLLICSYILNGVHDGKVLLLYDDRILLCCVCFLIYDVQISLHDVSTSLYYV